MKNFTLGLNVVLVVAVGVLFYLHFKTDKKAVSAQPKSDSTGSSFRIAYFEMDSLQNNYEYYKQIVKELGVSEQQKRSELMSKRNEYAAKVKEYQQKGQTMTQAEVANANQVVGQLEKEYQELEQAKGQEMQEEKMKKLQDIQKKIQDYLKDYNKDKGYSFIFMNSPDLIYYKDTVYNITNDLLKGLNEQYKKK